MMPFYYQNIAVYVNIFPKYTNIIQFLIVFKVIGGGVE